jgi:hypothetical protein
LPNLLAAHFVDYHMDKALFGYQKLLTVTFRYAPSMAFYTDAQGLLFIGLKIHKKPSSAGIFTAELTALFVT